MKRLMTEDLSKDANIYKFMLAQKFSSYQQLYNWSITDRAAFWRAAIETVDIKLTQPYTKILDLSHGVEKPDWLVNAKLNIAASCFQAPDSAIAIIYQDYANEIKAVSYSELHSLANRVSNSLLDLGLIPGDAIAIDMIMSVEAVAIYLGIIQAGYVVVGIADSFAAAEVEKRLAISKAKAIFTQDLVLRDGKQHPLYDKILNANLPKAIVLTALGFESNLKLRLGDLRWQEFLSSKATFDPVICNPSDRANILFSSGTTGDPKAIVWDHSSPIKAAVDGYLYQDIKPADRVAWPTSLGWMMGPWLIFATLINRATIALYYDAPTTKSFIDFVAAAKVTILGVVPSLVKNWRMHNYCAGVDWSAIKLFSSTGETSNTSDMQFLKQQAHGAPIIEYCGGTEIAGAYVTSTLLQENIAAEFSSPTLGIELKLIDQAGNYVDKGEVALVPPSIGLSRELLNRDNFTVYYAEMPKPKDGAVLRRHGDQMQRLANGYYKSLGRADDAMNLGGIKISAAEIEHCFLDISEILEAAAVGIDHDDRPTELLVFVVPASSATLDLAKLKQQLQTAINTKLNPLFKISEVKIITTLPRTNSNKIMRRVLRDTQ
jgi:acetyl-CoA synthetase